MNRKRDLAMLLALLTLAFLLSGCGDGPAADNVTPRPASTAPNNTTPTVEPTPAVSAAPTETPAPAKEEAQTATAVQTEKNVPAGAAAPAETSAPAGLTEPAEQPFEGDEAPPTFVDGQKLPRYQVTASDLGWSKARAACWDQGGYLAVISSREELNEIAALAEEQGLTYVWIGCHREDETLVWETGETVDYYNWGADEPSKMDYYDFVREDFIMIFRVGDSWYYNDNRDDPAGAFPDFYSGVMGYVCEFDR